jgi:hypothetical protein
VRSDILGRKQTLLKHLSQGLTSLTSCACPLKGCLPCYMSQIQVESNEIKIFTWYLFRTSFTKRWQAQHCSNLGLKIPFLILGFMACFQVLSNCLEGCHVPQREGLSCHPSIHHEMVRETDCSVYSIDLGPHTQCFVSSSHLKEGLTFPNYADHHDLNLLHKHRPIKFLT